MMKWLESRILWGSLLIIGGVLFLLQSLNIIHFGGLYWSLLLALGALFFFMIFFNDRTNWWALIPGIILVSIALVVAFSFLAPTFASIWGGSIVLGSIGLSFALIILLNRQMWWAIIPAGVLFSLALVTGLGNYLHDVETGGLFLVGLGLTFVAVAFVPTRQGRMWWAWIPAGALIVAGLVLTATTGRIIQYVLPIALIISGGALILYTVRPKRA